MLKPIFSSSIDLNVFSLEGKFGEVDIFNAMAIKQ